MEFVISEVNADERTWVRKEGREEWELNKVNTTKASTAVLRSRQIARALAAAAPA